MRAGKVTIQFSMNSKVEQMPVSEKQTETGTMRVSTPETTAFDLVRYQASAGYLSNVATVLSELAEYIDPQALVRVAPLVRLPDVQRLGYLLDEIGAEQIAKPLADWLKSRRARPVPLQPSETADIHINKRWHLLPNEKLEIDV